MTQCKTTDIAGILIDVTELSCDGEKKSINFTLAVDNPQGYAEHYLISAFDDDAITISSALVGANIYVTCYAQYNDSKKLCIIAKNISYVPTQYGPYHITPILSLNPALPIKKILKKTTIPSRNYLTKVASHLVQRGINILHR